MKIKTQHWLNNFFFDQILSGKQTISERIEARPEIDGTMRLIEVEYEASVLLIDDVRDLKCDFAARTYDEGINALTNKKWDLLLLDHDLGCLDADGEEKNGYHIVCWLEENQQYLPKRIQLVTSNPVGRLRMRSVINRIYGRSMC